jgi:outer membrane protein OmpA-like peptidoglycan-associated protein
MRAHDVVSLLSAAVSAAVLCTASVAHADDRLVLAAPNALGQNGLVRTTNAIVGDTGVSWLGIAGSGFTSTDGVVPGKDDANTLLMSNAVAGFSAFRMLELSVAMRAAANMNSARAQPQASVGDTLLSLKGGADFGLVAAALSASYGLPTRSNKVGFDLGNSSLRAAGHVTFDLLKANLPLRAHLLGAYTVQFAQLAGEGADNPYLLDGADGALIAIATQQWLHDQLSVGLGVEAPLPWVTPFLEVWYQAALGVDDYAFFGDAWLTLTPGVRLGLGGARIDLSADVGLSGTAGALNVDLAQTVAGQPINPLWTARIAVSHAFDLFATPTSSSSSSSSSPIAAVLGGGGGQGRLEGCVKDAAGVVADATVSLTIDGQPGPQLLVDTAGCFALPVGNGSVVARVTAPGHDDVSTTVAVNGSTARADVTMTARPGAGVTHVVGFATNNDDEAVEVLLEVTDRGGTRDGGTAKSGAFDLEVKSGSVQVTARAVGYLAQASRFVVEPGGRAATTFKMRKLPKKRSASLNKERLDTTSRMPFVFKTARLQSTAAYLLEEVADLLITSPATRLSIEAHTDASEVADPSEAKALTEARAQSVKDALVALGIAPDRLETSGMGLKSPLGAANDPKNRRVEFIVVGP